MLYKPSLLGAKNEKTKRILMCEVTFLRTVNARHFQICVACSFFAQKTQFFRVSATPELSVASGCTKPTKRRKNARKQAPTRQSYKKGSVDISESSTCVSLLLEKVFCGL